MSELAKRKVFFFQEKKFQCSLMPISFFVKCPECNYSNIGEEKGNEFWHGDIVYENAWKYLFWPIEVATFCPKCKKLIDRNIE